MKKSILIFGSALFLSMGFHSCGKQKALEIDVATLDTACDFVDALELVVDEMTVLVEDKELSADEEELFNKLQNKGDEINQMAESKFERSEAEKCENWELFRKKAEGVEQYMLR